MGDAFVGEFPCIHETIAIEPMFVAHATALKQARSVAVKSAAQIIRYPALDLGAFARHILSVKAAKGRETGIKVEFACRDALRTQCK